MTTPDRDLPPYDVARILRAPFPERVRLVCQNWASRVNPNPFIVLVMYWTKYLLLFVGGWAFFVSFSAEYPGFGSPDAWAFTHVAFQKALLWALFYESAGFGCSSGPMNGRIVPPSPFPRSNVSFARSDAVRNFPVSFRSSAWYL